MKKCTFLTLLLVFMISSSAQALSWAYPFVVWDGKVYEVKREEFIEKDLIGEVIGKVRTKPNDMTGHYHGNASNYYQVGTKYYEIKGISSSDALAIQEDGKWVKAVYIHKAPFHILNVFTNPIFIFSVVLVVLIIASFLLRNKRQRT